MGILKKSVKARLKKHIFFEKSNYWLNYQIDHIELPSRRKEKMAKRFLTNYVTIFRDLLMGFIEKGEYDDPSVLIGLYLKGMHELKTTSLSIGIPEIFLDKYDEYQNSQTLAMHEQLKSIVSSTFYKTDMDKIIAIFDVITYAFIYVILNAEETLTHMNGTLEHALEGSIFDV